MINRNLIRDPSAFHIFSYYLVYVTRFTWLLIRVVSHKGLKIGEKLEEKGTKFKMFACYKGMEVKYYYKKNKGFFATRRQKSDTIIRKPKVIACCKV